MFLRTGRTILKYPKDCFKKMEVESERMKMKYPKAWSIKQTATAYTLEFNGKNFDKYYLKKK